VFALILAELISRHIRFVVIGGVAAAVHGSARFTNDIDLCYDTADDNVAALVALLTSWKAYLRGVEPGLPFILDARAFRDTPIMTLTTTHGAIDVLDSVQGVGRYADAVRVSEAVRLGAIEFRALTLDALIVSKRATGRKRDIEHLVELEALQRLRLERGLP
jgi:predicted nucleotidyltransferase